MRWLPRFVCRHSTVHLNRAHPDVCKEHHGKQLWVDGYGCFNFVVCSDCKEVLKPSRQALEIYPMKEQ